VPLPHVTLERRFGIDLELVDVNVLAEDLPQGFDQPRMAGEQVESLVKCVGGKSGARRA
jgi:hypothetical protein